MEAVPLQSVELLIRRPDAAQRLPLLLGHGLPVRLGPPAGISSVEGRQVGILLVLASLRLVRFAQALTHPIGFWPALPTELAPPDGRRGTRGRGHDAVVWYAAESV